MKKLVIVESPSKSKTIEKYLGDDFKVVASMGHIRDLATSGKFGLGVDVENDFTPSYIPMKGKNKVITDLKKLVKDSDQIYLATDPDREGEAISWHLKEALSLKKDYQRVTFNEITKDVVIDAINNAKNNNITNAYFFAGDAGDFIVEQYKQGIKFDVVIMDPHRKGSDERFLSIIKKTKPSKVVYVSCDPATLARDLKFLSDTYDIKSVTPVDMFPHTNHVETITLLCLKEPKK